MCYRLQINIDDIVRTTFEKSGGGTAGPYTFGFDFVQGPGFFNSTTAPSSGFFKLRQWHVSSGFFNSDDGLSGIINTGTNHSGIWNAGALEDSGFFNYGALTSGLLNKGNTISGIFNTSTVDLATQAFVSGIANIGTQVSGFFHNVRLP
ncbi:hypothetical protein [Mycobacterium persicum]|uniref:PPE family protein PPE34 n=1 Tax=Mycobacterium persicum TaxID=1487726 RepID=A0A1X0LAR7_9MYCO|nr:hypothetical protein [Mycobacterium persicum]KZS84836.1 hypothetical protein A4G31_15885 [Mycobacterium persicum]ORB90623.1 hypothetical protein B1T49_16825 [Mycobacterium persicum]ORB96031.1 hypothetical protein B1T44_17710 [Mycobacterium persicum]ORC02742.1 hypothetical protein B1T48_17235 [Mycobacterium persicum]ORC08050.1 hypothetical protein B4U45_17040 [Mycobacterium persicum]